MIRKAKSALDQLKRAHEALVDSSSSVICISQALVTVLNHEPVERQIFILVPKTEKLMPKPDREVKVTSP